MKLLIPNNFVLKNKKEPLNCQEQSYRSIQRVLGRGGRQSSGSSSQPPWSGTTAHDSPTLPPTQEVAHGAEAHYLRSDRKKQRTIARNLTVRI